ncbi:hypothetical protein PCE1_000077 [Barthelona sp. PCE]
MNKFHLSKTIPDAEDIAYRLKTAMEAHQPSTLRPDATSSQSQRFYYQKVEFGSKLIVDQLSEILESFPTPSDIHPFYQAWISQNYGLSEFQGAYDTTYHFINQLKADSESCIDTIERTLMRRDCHNLKFTFFKRLIVKIKSELEEPLFILEETRMQLKTLPNIDPTDSALVLFGYPNVSKSSFVNIASNVDVDVQPYAFTTKTLQLGFFEFEGRRFQILDTPGILNRDIEERNVIEMQAIVAIAYLNCSVLFLVDASEECGYKLSEQLDLFDSLHSIFANKPSYMLFTKTDLLKYDDISEEGKKRIEESLAKVPTCQKLEYCSFETETVDAVKEVVCTSLLKTAYQKSPKIYSAVPEETIESRKPVEPISTLQKQQEATPLTAETTAKKSEIRISTVSAEQKPKKRIVKRVVRRGRKKKQ